jgi:hypothetical protein
MGTTGFIHRWYDHDVAGCVGGLGTIRASAPTWQLAAPRAAGGGPRNYPGRLGSALNT